MTTNIWLNYIMKDVNNFIGAYSINKIRTPTFFPSYTIVNFSPSYLPGTHFVAILFVDNRRCIYFDPLNTPFIPLKIKKYMKANSKMIHIIGHPVQNPLSGYCGFYCLLPIMFHINELPLLEGILSFPKASMKNDKKCISVLMKLFKIYYLEQN